MFNRVRASLAALMQATRATTASALSRCPTVHTLNFAVWYFDGISKIAEHLPDARVYHTLHVM